MDNIKFNENTIELTQGGEKHILFKEHIKFIKESNNNTGTNIIVGASDDDDYEFFTNCSYEIVKMHLDL